MEKTKNKTKIGIGICVLLILILIPFISSADVPNYEVNIYSNFSTSYNSNGVYNNGSSLIIGNINGSIDEVMLWSRSLSADEINLLYQGSLTKFNSSYYNYQTTQTEGQTCYTDGVLQYCSGQPVPHLTSGTIKYLTSISGSTKWEFDDNIEPKVTSSKSIGSSLFRWLKGWFVDLDVNGSILANGTINSTGGFAVNGNSGLTGNYSMLNSTSLQCWMNFTGGILTGSNC